MQETHYVFDISNKSFDIEHFLFDMPNDSFDIEHFLFDIEQFLFDIERLFDIELTFRAAVVLNMALLFDIEQKVVDIEQKSFDIERFSFDVSNKLFDIERFLFDISNGSFDIEQYFCKTRCVAGSSLLFALFWTSFLAPMSTYLRSQTMAITGFGASVGLLFDQGATESQREGQHFFATTSPASFWF